MPPPAAMSPSCPDAPRGLPTDPRRGQCGKRLNAGSSSGRPQVPQEALENLQITDTKDSYGDCTKICSKRLKARSCRSFDPSAEPFPTGFSAEAVEIHSSRSRAAQPSENSALRQLFVQGVLHNAGTKAPAAVFESVVAGVSARRSAAARRTSTSRRSAGHGRRRKRWRESSVEGIGASTASASRAREPSS